MDRLTVPARRSAIAVLAIVILVTACAEQGTPRPSATATATPAASGATAATPAASPPPTAATPVPHRIGVRVVGDQGELYDRPSGARFVPRGMNYVRLAGGHTTLNEGQGTG